jgi:hypothetical protein
VIVIPVMFSVVLPVLVSVDVSVSDRLFGNMKKLRLAGFSSTAVPSPVRLTACSLPGALSLIEMLAVRSLLPVGLNFTLIVQLAPGATELPKSSTWPKSPASAPVIVKK